MTVVVANTQSGRPTTPTLAERARTLTTRADTARIVIVTPWGRLVPMLHHVLVDGSILLLVSGASSLSAQVQPASGAERSAMVELADIAPVALRDPVRGLLWITGWLHALTPDRARDAASRWAGCRPDPRLLDVGHTARLLRLYPVFMVYSDVEGSGWLTPAELTSAEPDPLCHYEAGWLRHLEQAHPDVLSTLAGRLPAPPPVGNARVRPLGIDRLGLRLRIEAGNQAYNARLAFHHPATTPVRLAIELQRLVGCRPVAQPRLSHGWRPAVP